MPPAYTTFASLGSVAMLNTRAEYSGPLAVQFAAGAKLELVRYTAAASDAANPAFCKCAERLIMVLEIWFVGMVCPK